MYLDGKTLAQTGITKEEIRSLLAEVERLNLRLAKLARTEGMDIHLTHSSKAVILGDEFMPLAQTYPQLAVKLSYYGFLLARSSNV